PTHIYTLPLHDALPISRLTNQPPINSPRLRGGAILLTSDRPIGLRAISPSAIMMLAAINQSGETRPVSPPMLPAYARVPKAPARSEERRVGNGGRTRRE